MNAQPGNVDPEDVLQRMAREVGTLTAEKMIAESRADAALRQVSELTEQVVAGQTQINDLTTQADELRAEKASIVDERDELLRKVEKLRPERDGHSDEMDGQPSLAQPARNLSGVPECVDPDCENVTKYHSPTACLLLTEGPSTTAGDVPPF